MAISTLDGYIAAAKQWILNVRTSTTTSVAGSWFSTLDLSGNPGAGTLAGTSTSAGVVPTDADAGFPIINAFGGSAVGYLTNVEYGANVACRLMIADMLWKAGAYAFNASQALSSQPSYVGRLPGSDYNGTELWFEAVTAFTGNPTVTITYTNQSGTGSRTATFSPGLAPIARRSFPIPLQAGDTGIQKIDNVVATVASAGTFNLVVLRCLWTGRVKASNDGDVHGLDKVGMPIVYADSALAVYAAMDSTVSALFEIRAEVANA